jgi:hypothetical protein
MINALEIQDVPIACINEAAIIYHIPATLIISVLAIEGGHAGLEKANQNGSFDYGPMQINSVWLSKLQKYGYTQWQVQYDPCVNVMAGAWILSQSIANASATWRGIGDYHSKTPRPNFYYQKKVSEVYYLLSHYLSTPAIL